MSTEQCLDWLPSWWLPARPRWLSGCLAPWWSIVSALLILMTEHNQTRAGAGESLATPWSGPLSPEISWDSRGARGRVLTIIPLISFHYYQYSSSETLGQAWGQSQNKTASVFFNNKTLQWITKYYFKNYFTKLCWQEQIWCHFNFHWNNIWNINFIQ